MANVIRIKRRGSGAAGAPTALRSAELAHNEVDNTLYVGKGDDGSGNATTVVALAGSGAFADLSSAQTIGGAKTFATVPKSSQDAIGSTDLVRKSQHDLKADLASPVLTGTPAAPTPAADTNTTQIATTAFVLGQGASATPAMNGTAAVGTSMRFARADHVHPIDTSRAPLASPGFTGTPTAPTPASGDSSTKLATTAFVRSTSLDQLTSPAADVSFNAKKITGLADPVAAQDAATKNYVDLTVQGLDPKASVKAASTANIATLSGAMTVDGVALAAGDRILVKDQATPSQNGVYVVAASTWSRAADMDTWAEHVSAYLFVEQGTSNAECGFLCTSEQGGTLGTSAINFVQFNGAGQIIAGAGLTKTGNQLDVGTASSARIVVNVDAIDLATTGVGAGTYRSVTVDAYGRVTAASNPTSLAGYGITDAQGLDATLTALAGLTIAADQLIYATGPDAFAMTGLTAFARALLDDADQAAVRATLGLGAMAVQAPSSVAITGGTIDGVVIDGGSF